MNTPQTSSAAEISSLATPPQVARPLNESLSHAPVIRRHYAWGPAGEVKSARFFTGQAWGPKNG